VEYAIVIAAEVAQGTGVLAGEPVTTATLRSAIDGRDRIVRIVGGPTKLGGFARLAGHVAPITGARVRMDLREERLTSLAPPTLPGPSWIPSTPAGTWDSSALPITFVLALPASRDLGDDAAGELDVATRTWSRPACTAFRARVRGIQPSTAGDDGENGVFFHDATWPEELEPGALAQTILHVDSTGKLRDADIHVNGAEYRFSKDGAAGTQDIRGVFVHEIGHALGLGHSTDARATMNVAGSGLRWRSLEKDDIDGVCTLYPGAGSAGCDVDPCPSGFLCVAGACQRPGERANVCSPCTPELGACEAAGDDARCVDIGSGWNAGRVCGRACARTEDCGAGFACQPTTEAGDLQCVSLTACRNGANTCVGDADCLRPGSACRDGACVDPLPSADAGAGGVGDGSVNVVPSREESGGSDCACRSSPPFPGSSARHRARPDASAAVPLMAIVALATVRRAARRRRD
jgi:Matrixin